jgi:hypothetical protein
MSWKYALTVEEEAMAARIGYKRQESKLGQPEKNRNYSNGDVYEAWQHMVTVGSEIALARMLGLWDFVPHVDVYKSRQDIPGYEVRYSFTKPGGHAMRYTKGVDDPEAIYVLTTNGIEHKTYRNAETGWKGPDYLAAGWMRGAECVNPDWHYKGNTYYVPWRELYPMEVLP